MSETILVLVSGASLLLALWLAVQVKVLEIKIGKLEAEISKPDAQPTLPEPAPPQASPLDGLTVGVAIQQDHEHPTFAKLLLERLAAEDAEAFAMSYERARQTHADWSGGAPDILIIGDVRCNGYAEVFFRSELVIVSRGGTLDTICEEPASGGRQASLATTTVARLDRALAASLRRAERRLALRELHE